jgi:cytochrome c biogenesis protein
MAHEVGGTPLQPAIAAGQVAPKPTLMDRVDAVLEGLWHLLTSMRVAMLLMIAIAALGVVGALVIQAPVGVLNDAQAKTDWINEIRPRFGGWTNVMNFFQLFEIFNSVIFRVLIAALTISLVACSVHRTPGVWRTATKPRIDVGPSFFEHAPQHESIVVHQAPAEALIVLQGVLRKRHYRALTLDDGTVHVYADRFRWVPFASLAGHISLILILAGAIVGSTFGYRNSQFVIAEGDTIPTGAVAGQTIKLVDFTDTYYATTGAPQDYASSVVLYQDGTEVQRHVIRVNDPMHIGDTTFYQAFFGQAAVMTVKDKTGATVITGHGVPLAWTTTDGSRPIGSFTIPGSGVVGWVVGTTGTSDTQIQPGQMRLELYNSSGTSIASGVLEQGKATPVGDYTVTFDRESQFAGLNVARDPGVWLVWLGAFLLFAGFLVVFMLPQRRVWARIAPMGTRASVLAVASLGRRDAALGTHFEDLVTDIRAALQAPASQA